MPNILLPLMTGMLLVFAGILVGYFLWFRDRTGEEKQQQNLANENSRLAKELSSVQQQSTEFQEQSNKLMGKLQILQELCDDLATARDQSMHRQVELETELSIGQQLLDDSHKKVVEEQALRVTLEDRLHELNQRHLESIRELEGRWREKQAAARSALYHRENEIQQLRTNNERTADRLHQAEARIAELQSEIQAQRSLLETATLNVNGLEKEYVSLETSLRKQIELLNMSRGETAASLSAKQLAEESLRHARAQLEDQTRELLRLEKIAAEAERADQRCASLQQSLENNQARLLKIVAQRDAATSNEKENSAVIAGLRKQIENQETTIRTLRTEHEKVNHDLKREITARTMMENELIDQRRQGSQTENSLQNQLAQLEKSLEQSRNEHSTTVNSLTKKTIELANFSTELCNRNNELATTQSELAEARQHLVELEQMVAELQSRSREVKSRVEHVIGQRDHAMSKNQELIGQLDRLRAHSRANEETIRNLRRERGAILLRNRESRGESPRILSAAFGNDEKAQTDPFNGGKTRRDPSRGVIYDQAPDVVDDLKLISGIAEVLERQLNEYGIFTYRQIMEWDQAAIDEFSKLFTFKDRIERDDWVGQARRLYQWRYRRAA